MTADIRLGDWRDVLADVPDASVRLILTSPPYDNAREYEGTADAVDFAALADFAIRVLVPGGTLAMVLDGAVNEGVLSVTPFRVIVEWAARPEWVLSQVLAYGRTGQPGGYVGRFRRDHEPLIIFRKQGGLAVCNKDAVAAAAKHARLTNADHQWATRRDGAKQRNPLRSVRPIRHRGSIWDYGMVGNGQDPSSSTGHPATFAERFARDAVAVWSNPGDLVVDPFMGSGTVARACIDLGRRCIGAERVAKYHAKAVRRAAQTALPLADTAAVADPLGSTATEATLLGGAA